MQQQTPETAPFRYFAFISYSHADAKWAKWIQDAVEHYKLPAIIRKEAKTPLPKKLSPVFRDATHLGAGKLVENLHGELEASKFLIVVCSPSAASPNAEGKHFVDGEVRHFCELGRADRIIPVIVDGTPETAFCPKLKEEEILALDATKFPKARILNDIVARLLGLRPDDLWKREQRRRRRQLAVRGCLAMLGAAAMALAGWYWHDYRAEKVQYFKDFSDRNGVPQGLFALAPEDVAARERSYRFHFQGYDGYLPWRRKPVLRRLFCVNAQDRPATDTCRLPLHPECAERKFFYSENGALAEIRHARANGYETAIFRISGTNGEAIDVTRRGHDGQWGTPEWNLGLAQGATSAKMRRIAVERGADGLTRRIAYQKDSKGIPVAVKGVAAEEYEYEYDGLGRAIAKKTFGANGRPAVEEGAGGDEFRYAYAPDGDLATTTTLLNGEVVSENAIKVATAEDGKKYGEYGELVEERLLGKDGNVAFIVRYEYDETLSYRARIAYFDRDGLPSNNKMGWSAHTVKYERTGDGGSRRVEKWFDKDGNSVNQSPGDCAVVVRSFDANGRCTQIELYGADREKVVGKDGYHCAKFEYDRFGYKSLHAYFGTDGEPVVANLKDDVYCHAVRMINDENGNTLESTALGTDGNPMNIPSRGHAWVVKKYDSHSRVIDIELYDKDGNRAGLAANNCWRMVTSYDDAMGCETRLNYYVNGAYTKRVYDSSGKQLQESNHNADGSLVPDEWGVASVAMQYDGKGRMTKKGFFGVHGERTLSIEGIAGWENVYDERSNLVEERRFGLNGETCGGKAGIAFVKWQYDDAHREIAKDFFDANGNPVPNSDGDYGMRWEYDERGNMTASWSIDKVGKCKPDANGVGIVRNEYDSKGRNVKRRFFDTDGKPCKSAEGIGGWTSEYDEAGHEICRMFFDENEAPCLCGGRAGWRKQFGEDGRETGETNLGIDGNPMEQILQINGVEFKCGEVETSYDSEGRKIVLAECSTSDVRKIKVICTRDGDWEQLAFLDADGKFVNSPLDYARKENRYNEFRELTEESWWGSDGKPVAAPPEMIHKTTIRYTRSKNGLEVDARTFGIDDFPVVGKTCGFARTLVRYDAQGRLLSQEYFDERNNPIVPEGAIAFRIEYDSDGNGKRICMRRSNDPRGFAKMQLEVVDGMVSAKAFNADGEVVETQSYDWDEAPQDIRNLWRIRYAVDENRRPTQIIAPGE